MGSSGDLIQYYGDNTTSPLTLDINQTSRTPARGGGGTDWWRQLVHSPDWPELWDQLRWAWHLHVYGLACLFLALTFAAFFTILRLRAQLSTKPHLTTLNVFLCLLGSARSLSLFADPYGSRKVIPLVMSRILWDLGYPCLLSAFALLQLSFLRMSNKVRLVVPSGRLSGETAASVIVTSHFCLIIMSDILWAVRNSFRIVWLLTQVVFVLWGLFLCLTFLCGCLKLLRSVAKLPLQFLSRIEPGYEFRGVLPMNVILSNDHRTNRSQQQAALPSKHSGSSIQCGPKIRITDVNDQTYSFVSDGSPAVFNEPQRRTMESVSAVSLQRLEPKWSSSRTPLKTAEDPALTCPLMNDRDGILANSLSEEPPHSARVPSEIRQNGPATISNMHKGGSYVQRPLRKAAHLEDFTLDVRKLKTSQSSRLERLLRKLVVTSILGTVLCLLRAYDVFGPHGLSSSRSNAAAIPWFCFQTLTRIVEFFMGCCMACITRQSLHNPHYDDYYKKHREPMCYYP